MLLELQNKKRLLMARQEQDAMSSSRLVFLENTSRPADSDLSVNLGLADNLRPANVEAVQAEQAKSKCRKMGGSLSAGDKSSPAPTSKAKGFTGGNSKRRWEKEKVNFKHTGIPTRDACIRLIYNGLAFTSKESSTNIMMKAIEVEQAAYDEFKGDTVDYRAKIRSLFHNLKKLSNHELSSRVMSDEITPAQFVIMSNEGIGKLAQSAYGIDLKEVARVTSNTTVSTPTPQTIKEISAKATKAEEKTAPSQLPEMVFPHRICALCMEIPFAALPFEDESGLPHQPDLKALKDSAKSCALCGLILNAALAVRKDVDEEYKQVTRGRCKTIEPGRVLSSGKKIYGVRTQGRYVPGGGYIVGPYEVQNCNKPGFPFGDDLSVRPWLVGNWWRPRSPDDPWQLMGLGVRLAATPRIEDAEGNGKENEVRGDRGLDVHFHGSYMRVRTDDGKCIAIVMSWD